MYYHSNNLFYKFSSSVSYFYLSESKKNKKIINNMDKE